MILNETVDRGTWIEVRSVIGDETFKVDKDDWSRVKNHRWRIGNGRVWTEMNGHLIQLPDLLIAGENRPTMVFKNRDELDFRKANWVRRRFMNSPSLITVHGEISTLHLNNGVSVRFNTRHIEKIDYYRWYALQGVKGQPDKVIVKTNVEDGQLMLHRHIVDAHKGEIVRHLNGDYTDCRDCNLHIPGRNWNEHSNQEYEATDEHFEEAE